MAVIRWSAEAAADLQAIHDFIARDSSRYARAVCGDIVEAVDQLVAFPMSGRLVPELTSGAGNATTLVHPESDGQMTAPFILSADLQRCAR